MYGHLRRCAGRVALALLTLSFSWQAASTAPAPFDRTAVRTKQLCRGDLFGTWTLIWAGQRGGMTLSPEGDYVCHCGGMTYVGVDIFAQQIVFGIMLVLAVAVTIDRSKIPIVK